MPSKKSANKSPAATKVINEAVHVLECFGLPMSGKTARQREKTAMAFLAVAGVSHTAGWSSAGDCPPLGTRKIIDFINTHFAETISKGSYDDIRRKDLKAGVQGGIVVASAGKPDAAVNDPTRAYALSPDFLPFIRGYHQKNWQASVAEFMKFRPGLETNLQEPSLVPVQLPGGEVMKLSPGQHNLLQKAIVEKFLPQFGFGSAVVYLSDTAEKSRFVDADLVTRLKLDLGTDGKLPDVIAWSKEKNWLYLIEAVHSFGPISNARRLDLEEFSARSPADVVYVTAFLDVHTFRRCAADIGWETEVWIAEEPEHMIHWNGHCFLGPRKLRIPRGKAENR